MLVFGSDEGGGTIIGIRADDELEFSVGTAAILNGKGVVDEGRFDAFVVAYLSDPGIAEKPQGAFRCQRHGIDAVTADPTVGLLKESLHFGSGVAFHKGRLGSCR